MINMERITLLNNEKFLRQISKEVDFNDKSYIEDIEKLKKICQNDGIFALASVQIGIPKRIIYIRNTTSNLDNNFTKGYDEEKIYINPVILRSYGLTKYLEACASCPVIDITEMSADEHLLTAIMKRPYALEIEYYDINGNKKNEIIKGFEATIFSHENDHLNGVLHIDRTDDIWKMDLKQRTEYRKLNPYEIISKNNDFVYQLNGKNSFL